LPRSINLPFTGEAKTKANKIWTGEVMLSSIYRTSAHYEDINSDTNSQCANQEITNTTK